MSANWIGHGWGGTCPNCGMEGCDLLSTTNEWDSHCVKCDIRFNDRGEIRPDDRAKLIPSVDDHFTRRFNEVT